MKIKVSGAQIPIVGDVECNYEAINYAMDYAIENQSDILLTPEGSLSGYFPAINQKDVDTFLEKLVNKAKDNKLGLALGTCYRENDEKIYNQIRFYDKNGNYLGFHSKILKTSGEESDYQSTPLRTFNFHGITIGGLICNDLWANPSCTVQDDPHLSQKLADMGTKIIFHAVNGGRSMDEFMDVYRNFHESNLQVRANAGKIWIITVDNCFPMGIRCSAPSGVIDPSGFWQIKTNPIGDQFFTFEISLND